MKIEIMFVPRFTFYFSTLSVSEDNWSICSALPIRKQNTTASTFIVVPKRLRWIGCAAENQLKFNTWDWRSPNSSLATEQSTIDRVCSLRLLVRDDSATCFLFELLFVTRLLTNFVKASAIEQSAIERDCSLHIIGS